MAKKLLLTLPALFAGPLLVAVTSLFYSWSLYGGIGTACVVSFIAVQSVWKKAPPDGEEQS